MNQNLSTHTSFGKRFLKAILMSFLIYLLMQLILLFLLILRNKLQLFYDSKIFENIMDIVFFASYIIPLCPIFLVIKRAIFPRKLSEHPSKHSSTIHFTKTFYGTIIFLIIYILVKYFLLFIIPNPGISILLGMMDIIVFPITGIILFVSLVSAIRRAKKNGGASNY